MRLLGTNINLNQQEKKAYLHWAILTVMVVFVAHYVLSDVLNWEATLVGPVTVNENTCSIQSLLVQVGCDQNYLNPLIGYPLLFLYYMAWMVVTDKALHSLGI